MHRPLATRSSAPSLIRPLASYGENNPPRASTAAIASQFPRASVGAAGGPLQHAMDDGRGTSSESEEYDILDPDLADASSACSTGTTSSEQRKAASAGGRGAAQNSSASRTIRQNSIDHFINATITSSARVKSEKLAPGGKSTSPRRDSCPGGSDRWTCSLAEPGPPSRPPPSMRPFGARKA